MRQDTPSRQRMLTALEAGRPDHTPCCFMIFRALRNHCRTELEFVQRQLEMGLDARVELPDLPIRFAPEVSVRQWSEPSGASGRLLLHREYQTPSGNLTASVNKASDWPYGEDVPLFDDYLAPRSEKFLVTAEEDIEPLKHLLAEPAREGIDAFRQRAGEARKMAADLDLLFCAEWRSEGNPPGLIGSDPGRMGVDALMWICGPTQPLYWAYDHPQLLEELLLTIARWNRKRMEIVLEEKPDLIIKRAWYEGTEFWSPALYRRFIFPILEAECRLAHESGARFGYILTSGVLPIVDLIAEAGVDVLIGLDPVQGKASDPALIKQKCQGRMAIWGGVNGFLTVEMGRAEEVREAVAGAMKSLAPDGGFILSPVDNVREDTPKAWDNVRMLIRTWQEMR